MRGEPCENEGDSFLWTRLAWMAAIWLGSVGLLAAVVMAIRWWLR